MSYIAHPIKGDQVLVPAKRKLEEMSDASETETTS